MKPVDIEELKGILEEAKNSGLDPEDHAKLQVVADSYRYLAELLSEEGATVERVRQRFFERFKIIRDAKARRGDDTDTAPSN